MMEYLLGACGTLCVLLLGYLINQISGLFAKIDSLRIAITTKVDVSECKEVRGDCIALNKRLIYDPLDVQIAQLKANCNDRWETYLTEHKKFWDSLDSHTHSGIEGKIKDDQVIYK